MLIATAMVLFMQGGFTALESGVTKRKNTINATAKNMVDFGAAVLTFYIVGYALISACLREFRSALAYRLEVPRTSSSARSPWRRPLCHSRHGRICTLHGRLSEARCMFDLS
ncbi:hypothetical protein [Aquisalimonas lutea]|uniref:hypothetical protein n=1 Tax=Aquisalimonas lutea TaxID=1327750 RepID=UPI00338F8E4D